MFPFVAISWESTLAKHHGALSAIYVCPPTFALMSSASQLSNALAFPYYQWCCFNRPIDQNYFQQNGFNYSPTLKVMYDHVTCASFTEGQRRGFGPNRRLRCCVLDRRPDLVRHGHAPSACDPVGRRPPCCRHPRRQQNGLGETTGHSRAR